MHALFSGVRSSRPAFGFWTLAYISRCQEPKYYLKGALHRNEDYTDYIGPCHSAEVLLQQPPVGLDQRLKLPFASLLRATPPPLGLRCYPTPTPAIATATLCP